ncbi:MAG TPA: chemotaxis response regulator protein-glutamate methylesterase [Firmicutes bacterium]|nr:chemotaxis response regulator protein-glutamate methylesterase [Bacillota bacterium]
MQQPIRVLVVDDSALMRQIITDILKADPGIQVVGGARDGLDALEKISWLKPDVVTLDVEMPRLDGLATLERIMAAHPLPVVMLSALTTRGAEITIRALELGAIDFVAKPHTVQQDALGALGRELAQKVKAAARVDLKRLQRPALESPLVPARPPGFSPAIVVIGLSSGGPSALSYLLTQLPDPFPLGIVIAQHMPPGFTRYLAERLDSICRLRVREAREGDLIEPGLVLIAPAGSQLRVQRSFQEGRVSVQEAGPRDIYKPSADILFASAAEAYGRQVLALILTGMGSDGAVGLAAVKERGGFVIAEAPETCLIYGMPRAAVEAGVVDEVLPLNQIPVRLCQLAGVRC